MENTLENKAKFFSLFFKQKVLRTGLFPELIPVATWTLNNPLKEEYLELKPLSSITDEDALEIANILKVELHTESLIQFIHNSIKTYIDKGYKGIDSHILDFLRSKGYTLPWMGLSVEKLVEYGWIKLK